MKHLNLILSSLLILSIGLFTGFSIGYHQARASHFPTIEWQEDVNPKISTLKLLNYEDEILYGQVAGQEIRLAYSDDKIKTLKPGDWLEIPLNEIDLKNYYAAKDVPFGVNFIASKTGKYFYHVLDPRALRIDPKNRRYFSDTPEAISAGYLEPK